VARHCLAYCFFFTRSQVTYIGHMGIGTCATYKSPYCIRLWAPPFGAPSVHELGHWQMCPPISRTPTPRAAVGSNSAGGQHARVSPLHLLRPATYSVTVWRVPRSHFVEARAHPCGLCLRGREDGEGNALNALWWFVVSAGGQTYRGSLEGI
jgi:hypothetical protein